MHLFGHNLDHDYYFELLREEERDAQFRRAKLDVAPPPLRCAQLQAVALNERLRCQADAPDSLHRSDSSRPLGSR